MTTRSDSKQTTKVAMVRKVLVVDDDESVLRLHARVLAKDGFEVVTATGGEEAIRALQSSSFDVIMSDIDMPGMNGVELLERVRTFELDIPLVLVTGAPSVDTAIRALEHGALRYLLKPVDTDVLVSVANDAVRLHHIAKAKRQALVMADGQDRLLGDQAGLTASFDRAIETLFVAYQPIVSWSKQNVFGTEALVRCKEPSFPHPGALFDAAERLGRVHELGRVIRARAIERLPELGAGVALFLNLHPHDLLDHQLFDRDSPLSRAAPRIVLEITERASLHGMSGVSKRIADLHTLGFRIALDDLGAGYAGLTSFALLKPDIVKLDMALVRDLHLHPIQQTLVRTMVAMCKELELAFIGEGVETVEERDELARCGCDLMQGYLFAKPGQATTHPTF